MQYMLTNLYPFPIDSAQVEVKMARLKLNLAKTKFISKNIKSIWQYLNVKLIYIFLINSAQVDVKMVKFKFNLTKIKLISQKLKSICQNRFNLANSKFKFNLAKIKLI